MAARNPSPRPTLAAARKFVLAPRAEKRFLLLLGPRGVGKTVAATVVLREALLDLLSQERPSGGGGAGPDDLAAFVTGAEFGRMSAFGADSAAFERLLRVRVLVLDDATRAVATREGKPSSVACALLFELLSHRHGARRATVITDNRPLESLGERRGFADWCALVSGSASPVDCPLWDRISNTMICAQTPGESLRARKAT